MRDMNKCVFNKKRNVVQKNVYVWNKNSMKNLFCQISILIQLVTNVMKTINQ